MNKRLNQGLMTKRGNGYIFVCIKAERPIQEIRCYVQKTQYIAKHLLSMSGTKEG